jgi:hypothetical protein
MTKQIQSTNDINSKRSRVSVIGALRISACLVIGAWSLVISVWPLVLGAWSLGLLLGCNSASVSGTVPAGGKVTYQGAGVEGAIVTFVSEDDNGRPATATTGAGGEFHLTTVDAPGALPGKYKVTVDKVQYAAGGSSSMEDAARGNAAESQPKRLLPAKYAAAASTPLAIEVPSGGKQDLDLTLVD